MRTSIFSLSWSAAIKTQSWLSKVKQLSWVALSLDETNQLSFSLSSILNCILSTNFTFWANATRLRGTSFINTCIDFLKSIVQSAIEFSFYPIFQIYFYVLFGELWFVKKSSKQCSSGCSKNYSSSPILQMSLTVRSKNKENFISNYRETIASVDEGYRLQWPTRLLVLHSVDRPVHRLGCKKF